MALTISVTKISITKPQEGNISHNVKLELRRWNGNGRQSELQRTKKTGCDMANSRYANM